LGPRDARPRRYCGYTLCLQP